MDNNPEGELSAEVKKHPGGRPSDYLPKYCEYVIEYGSRGKSKAWIAAELGVSRVTLDTWTKVYPEFLCAMEKAADLSQKWWEDAGQDNLKTQGFSAAIWSRSMAARFPNDWREKSESKTTVSGDPEAPLVTEFRVTIVDPGT